MPFYHFTAAHLLKPILEQGLTRGCTPVFTRTPAPHISPISGFIRHTQWLTTNKDFRQDWCFPEFSSLPYDRNAFRLTIVIPNTHRDQLFTWDDFYRTQVLPKGLRKFPGFDNRQHCNPDLWRIFVGAIHPLWIKNFQQNPGSFRSVAHHA